MSYATQPPTKEQIAAARGNFFVKRNDEFDPEKECRPLRELKAAEQELVARRKAAVIEHLPDMAPFFYELHEAGMIDGWRGVVAVELIDDKGVLPYAPTGRKRHGTA